MDRRFSVFAALLLLMLASCVRVGPQDASSVPATLLPDEVAGWTSVGDVATHDRDTLTELVNGQAAAYFAYDFQRVAVSTYQNAASTTLRVEIWELSDPLNAYGLFTWSRAGEPVALGNAGDADPGRRVAFWQARYYVQVRATQPVPDAELTAFAEALSAALPQGGETPQLVARLPGTGLLGKRAVYFRRELSIQDLVWLGGEDLLGLDGRAEGVVAPYEVDGQVLLLMVVAYPDGDAAAEAAARLGAARPDQMVTVVVSEDLLAAVFGGLEASAAEAWVVSVIASIE
ncbi:MAG: hypothetical protein JXC32_03485 [Anaerolineae bacterium]|nr:hypothetical protein [Anaerolineae bacterium]